MKRLSVKNLYFAWAIACLFAVSVIVALAASNWFFIATFIFSVWYVVIIFKMLHCPHCGKMESLINLTYAMNHRYYCRNCGQQIILEKETMK